MTTWAIERGVVTSMNKCGKKTPEYSKTPTTAALIGRMMSRSIVSSRESICSGSGAVSFSNSRSFWKPGQRVEFMLALVRSSEHLVFHGVNLADIRHKTRDKVGREA